MKTRATVLTVLAGMALAGCSNTAGKVTFTPLTVVRDIVDAPVVSLTNVFDYWAEGSSKIPTANAGVSVTPSGVTPGLHINFNYWIFKPISLILGSVDYLVCRSLYPCWPAGISPWRAPEQTWGSLYFPNTRALWGDEEGGLDDGAEDAGEPAPYER